MEFLNEEQRTAACEGYEYFGFHSIAELLRRARSLFETASELGQYERVLDGEYADIIPSDATISEAFERHLLNDPESYAPLEE